MAETPNPALLAAREKGNAMTLQYRRRDADGTLIEITKSGSTVCSALNAIGDDLVRLTQGRLGQIAGQMPPDSLSQPNGRWWPAFGDTLAEVSNITES